MLWQCYVKLLRQEYDKFLTKSSTSNISDMPYCRHFAVLDRFSAKTLYSHGHSGQNIRAALLSIYYTKYKDMIVANEI